MSIAVTSSYQNIALMHHHSGCKKVYLCVYSSGGCSQFLCIVLIQYGQDQHLDHRLHCAELGQLCIKHNLIIILILYARLYCIYLMHHLPTEGYPSCLHTTWASLEPQLWSQTVPHTPPEHSSTLPCRLLLPPETLMAPSTVQLAAIKYNNDNVVS